MVFPHNPGRLGFGAALRPSWNEIGPECRPLRDAWGSDPCGFGELPVADLTRGSIARHVLGMAAFLAAGMAFQSAYFIVDLYFVSRIGKEAVAGVGSAGNFFYLALSAAQLVGVGCVSLISQAIGRKDAAYARLVFNQVLVISLIFSAVTLVLGYAGAASASRLIGADAATAAQGRDFLYGDLPALAAMFPSTVLGASLRASGIVRPTMLLQTAAVVVNIVLAPVLIAGWLTGVKLGAFGAGLASSIASVATLGVLVFILPRVQSRLLIRRHEWKPRLHVWLSLMRVGLPAAGEFLLIFLTTMVLYWAIRRFGPTAQAGYGIGARIMQALFLPTLAVSFAAGPVAGQNVGAKNRARVLRTFGVAVAYATALMLGLTALCQFLPEGLARPFSSDSAVLLVSDDYLRIVSWNFVATGIVFVCSGMFQALADTMPSFLSGASRLVTFVVPCLILSSHPSARLLDFWRVALVAGFIQAGISLLLLRRSLARHLPAA
jgi:putative MATE family efflux protein